MKMEKRKEELEKKRAKLAELRRAREDRKQAAQTENVESKGQLQADTQVRFFSSMVSL